MHRWSSTRPIVPYLLLLSRSMVIMSWRKPLFAYLISLLPLCWSQDADFSIPSPYSQWDNENWILSTRDLLPGYYQSRAPMGNGYALVLGLGCISSLLNCALQIHWLRPRSGRTVLRSRCQLHRSQWWLTSNQRLAVRQSASDILYSVRLLQLTT